MIRTRKKGPNSDQSRGVSDKEMSMSNGAATPTEKNLRHERVPKKVGNGSSIRSFRMDDDEDNVPNRDPYAPLRVSDSPRSRSSTRNGYDAPDNDPYMALRIADSPRRISVVTGNSHNYASLKVADGRTRRKSPTRGNGVPRSQPYLPLKIAANRLSGAENGNDELHDWNGSSSAEDGASDSAGSRDEQMDDELSEFAADSGSEDIENDSSTSYARVSVRGGESEPGKGDRGSGYARISVAGSVASYRMDAVQEARTVEYGNNGDEEFPGYARISVAGSEIDYGKDVYAKVSLPGSEVDYGKDVYARVSVAGSNIDHGQDVYAKLSVAESEAGHGSGVEGDFSGYARLSVAGSEVGDGQDTYARVSVVGSEIGPGKDIYAKVSVAGSEVDHGNYTYARIFVAGSEAEYGTGSDRDGLGYARLRVLGSKDEHAAADVVCPGYQALEFEMGQVHGSEKGFSCGNSQDHDDQGSWDKEYDTYMELTLASRAKLQYRVRVVSISPLFEQKGRQLSSFSDIYKIKFREPVEATGFTSAAKLCCAMPHLVQRAVLEETGVVVLVDSIENRRALSGIRSGLRRIVYEALMSNEELSCPQLEEKCSELLGKPLLEVLSEHGYDTPNVESLVKDMLDIAGFEEAGLESQVHLCAGAEDPAWTDGLLIRSTSRATMKTSNIAEATEIFFERGDRSETAKDSGITERHTEPQRETLKLGSSLTLRSLKNELRRFGSFSHTLGSSLEDALLQARLHMRILLAFHNSGRGVEVTALSDLYAGAFGRSLDLHELRVSSIMELIRNWHDIFLLQEPIPGWVFLVPSQANRRLLNTFRSGLRSGVFSVLVETYPEGLGPLDFLRSLQQAMSGELWEVLDASGYICSDGERADSVLSSSTSSDFQLVDFEEVCVLLDDMMDFVRLGSNEDGAVVVKLRNGEAPLADLLDCKLAEIDGGSFDELLVNLMMIAVDDDSETSGPDAGSLDDCGYISVGHVQSLVNSFEGTGGLRSAHSQTPDSIRLKHEIRLILGCPEYLESGIPWNELSNIYKDRTGQELGSRSKVKSLLRAMPDIVCKDSFGGDSAHLSKTPKNMRILSATKAGLRQVLFWALVKNPGGVWASLLEGWFTDFTGMSLAATLHIHGYEMSKRRPFFPVYVFLRDMNDLLVKKSSFNEVYTWGGAVKDPIHDDACLISLSELLIQYDPVRVELGKLSTRGADLMDTPPHRTIMGEDPSDIEANAVSSLVGNISSKTDESYEEAGLEVELAERVSTQQEINDTELRLEHQPVPQPAGKEDDDWDEKYHECPKTADVLVNGDNECCTSVRESQLLSFQEAEEAEAVKAVDTGIEVDANGEQDHDDSEGEDCAASGENEEVAEDDESDFLQHEDAAGWDIEEEKSEPISEAYAQLRVAGKGPKVNLDEWQFTDSEDEDEDYEVNDDIESDFHDEEESVYSENGSTSKEQGKTLPAGANGEPKVKVTAKDTSRAWVLPNKGIPWK